MEKEFTIEIPCDFDGYVLLQCPKCGELFKLQPGAYESDEVLCVCCPSCGLVSDSYLTDDVLELALAKTKNYALDLIYGEIKKLERETKGNTIEVKARQAPKHENEPVLQPSVDALVEATCNHCGKHSKIARMLQMSMYICPLCGVNNFNER